MPRLLWFATGLQIRLPMRLEGGHRSLRQCRDHRQVTLADPGGRLHGVAGYRDDLRNRRARFCKKGYCGAAKIVEVQMGLFLGSGKHGEGLGIEPGSFHLAAPRFGQRLVVRRREPMSAISPRQNVGAGFRRVGSVAQIG